MNKPIPIQFSDEELAVYKRRKELSSAVDLVKSQFEWIPSVACTIKAYGNYTDDRGCKKSNILNQETIPRFKKGIDIAVSETRREFDYQFGCVFFEGGSYEYETSYHLHGIIECPEDPKLKQTFLSVLKRKVVCQVTKWIRTNGTLEVPVWFEELNGIEKYAHYCQRPEDGKSGNEKICFDMKSHYIPRT